MLAFKLLWRNARSYEVKLLATALLLAVTLVSAIGIFSDRLENTLLKQSHSFLGADRQIRSPQAIPLDWLQQAQNDGVQQARYEAFSSMVFSSGDDERMQLAAIKAVEAGYPLVGQLEINRQPYRPELIESEPTDKIPAAGEAWVEARLLAQLNIQLNDLVYVGEKELRVTHVLVREPDRGGGFSLFSPRLMMNRADLAATEVIQPGSRISYHWLLEGDDAALNGIIKNLSPALTEHQRIIDLEKSQQGLASTLSRARQFLLLAIVMAVLLAGVAIVISANRFFILHIEQVALLKSLGASKWRVRRLYVAQLCLLTLLSAVAGLLLGELAQRALSALVAHYGAITLLPAGVSAYGLGIYTAFICLLFFALPPLWSLPSISPLRILRHDIHISTLGSGAQFILGMVALLLLIYGYSQSVWLTVSVAGALLSILIIAALLAYLLLKLSHRFMRATSSSWRLALAGISRRRGQSILQIVVFSIALLLLFTMYSLRSHLIDDWQLQLPSDSPNHFLLNIAGSEVPQVEKKLASRNINSAEIYPMVRGRLTAINDVAPSELLRDKVALLRREANVSWSEKLPEDNTLVAGNWWDERFNVDLPKVSVESTLAEQLQLSLGDKLEFSFGGLKQSAVVSSFRSLQWDNMKPNFYFIFEPNSLDKYMPMYMTSINVPAGDYSLISEILHDYPSIVVIEIGKIIEQIRDIIDKVGQAIELVLAMILVAGVLVLAAAVNASIDSRLQEIALVRALGSARKIIVKSLWLEFALLGGCAGAIAVFGSEILLMALQYKVFNMQPSLHYEVWLAGPIIGALLVGAFGVWNCRRVITTPPAAVLRELN